MNRRTQSDETETFIGDTWAEVNLAQIEMERRKAAFRIVLWGAIMLFALVVLGAAYAALVFFTLQSAAEAAALAPAMMRF